jgi:hypothetical protein
MNEILRCAQDDGEEAQDDGKGAQDDGEKLSSWRRFFLRPRYSEGVLHSFTLKARPHPVLISGVVLYYFCVILRA